mgnify:FL=1
MFLRRSIVRVLLSAGAAAALVFVGSSATTRSWRDRFTTVILPVGTGVRSGANWVGSWFSSGKGAAVRALEAERVRLLSEIARLEAAGRENEVLREALALRGEGEEGVIPARVVGFFRDGRDEYLLLNRGVADGVGTGDLVLDGARVLGGTVVDVAPHFSRVILISSASRSTDVIIPRIELRAIARGANAGELIVELVPQGAGVEVGDLLMASPRAAGGRSGLLVGEIREVRLAEHEVFKTVRAIQLFDPSADEVLILLAP